MGGTYLDLRVWKDAMDLAELVYERTADFPRTEAYGLTSQIRRAAVSVPSNIAEGKGHRSDREFGKFLLHARGSLLELQTQVRLAERLKFLGPDASKKLLQKSDQVGRELNALLNSLKRVFVPAEHAND